jgi:hypothetical protein
LIGQPSTWKWPRLAQDARGQVMTAHRTDGCASFR